MPAVTRPVSQNRYAVNWQDLKGQVTVDLGDGDRFVMNVEQVREALRINQAVSAVLPRVRKLLDTLAAWIEAHRTVLRRGFLTIHGRRLLFLAETQDQRFHFDIEDDLFALDESLLADADLRELPFHAMSIPVAAENQRPSMLSEDMALVYSVAG